MSMVDMNKLRTSILEVIKDNNYDLNDLKEILSPVAEYFSDRSFLEHIEDIVSILTTDRNGDKNFTVDDLKFLKNDILAITSLVTSIMLVLGSLPGVELKYNGNVTEEVVFKILVYIMVVVIPKQTGSSWTLQEKESVLDLTLLIYKLVKSSNVTKDAINKVKEWFKSKGWCACMSAPLDPDEVIEKRLPKQKRNLKSEVEYMQDIREINEKIANETAN